MTLDANMTVHNYIDNIVIVGGGTAGWLSACHLAKNQPHCNITVIESPNIPTIGVGEGSVPSVAESLKALGISETDLIREAYASHKQSVEFINWKSTTQNDSKALHRYHHIFEKPACDLDELIEYWKHSGTNSSFVDVISAQGAICDNNLAPKVITMPEYKGVSGYAFHFDALRLAKLLKDHACKTFNVKHIEAELVDVTLCSDGNIGELRLDTGEGVSADLFVDCTGFKSLLLGKALCTKFIDKQDVLFTDSALTTQIHYKGHHPEEHRQSSSPYVNNNVAVASSTKATAQDAGWIWDIALSNRRGVGYVFSSKHTTAEKVETQLRDYLANDAIDDLTFRQVDFKVGYRELAWSKNCVGIGLSQGFVEPLEATGIMMIDDVAKALAAIIPRHKSSMPAAARKLNQIVSHQWTSIIDFIKIHYVLSDRSESFWCDNRSQSSIPDTLADRLSLWHSRLPSDYDFTSRHDVFYRINYLYILLGMDCLPDAKINNKMKVVKKVDYENTLNYIQHVRLNKEKLLHVLPSNTELLYKIKLFGLQSV